MLGRLQSRLRSGLGQGAKPTGPQWLDGYTGQTTGELLALEGVFRTDSIVLAFEQALKTKASRVGLPSLKAIGAAGAAETAEAAIDALGIEGIVTAKAVERAINLDDEDDVMEERLNQFDERYYQTAGDLADPLLVFIKANLDQIVVRWASPPKR